MTATNSSASAGHGAAVPHLALDRFSIQQFHEPYPSQELLREAGPLALSRQVGRSMAWRAMEAHRAERSRHVLFEPRRGLKRFRQGEAAAPQLAPCVAYKLFSRRLFRYEVTVLSERCEGVRKLPNTRSKRRIRDRHVSEPSALSDRNWPDADIQACLITFWATEPSMSCANAHHKCEAPR